MLNEIDQTLTAVKPIAKNRFYSLCDITPAMWNRMLLRAKGGRDITTKQYRTIQNAIRDYYNLLLEAESKGRIPPKTKDLFKARVDPTPKEIRAYIKMLDRLDDEITVHLENTRGKSKSAIARPVNVQALTTMRDKPRKPKVDLDGFDTTTIDDGPVIDSSRVARPAKLMQAPNQRIASKLNRSGKLGRVLTPLEQQRKRRNAFLARSRDEVFDAA